MIFFAKCNPILGNSDECCQSYLELTFRLSKQSYNTKITKWFSQVHVKEAMSKVTILKQCTGQSKIIQN